MVITKSLVLCLILIGFWSETPVVLAETFEYECDILHKLDYLESKEKETKQMVEDLTNKDKEKQQLLISLERKVNTSDKVVAVQERVINDLESKVSVQAQFIVGLSNKVATLEDHLRDQRVVFHVQNVSVQPGKNSIIKFTDIVENTDGIYDLTTGLFTAPAEGTYWFTAQLCADASKAFCPSIFVNDKLLARAYMFYSGYRDCSPVSVVATLAKGDTVSVQTGPHQHTDPVWIMADDEYLVNAFMGARLF